MKMIEKKVRKIISHTLQKDLDYLSPTEPFVDKCGLDSLDMMEVVMNIEDHFDVNIPESDIRNVKTLEDFVNLIKDKVCPWNLQKYAA